MQDMSINQRLFAKRSIKSRWRQIFGNIALRVVGQKLGKRFLIVERVNAYLKEGFQLKNVRYPTGKKAKVHFDLVTLVYNA
jgi:hypothetical protein